MSRVRRELDMDEQMSTAFVYILKLPSHDWEGQRDFGLKRSKRDPREHDLRCAVPSRGHVFGHEARLAAIGLCRHDAAGEAKVAHLEIAIGVEQQV